jgi:hypothetical protein
VQEFFDAQQGMFCVAQGAATAATLVQLMLTSAKLTDRPPFGPNRNTLKRRCGGPAMNFDDAMRELQAAVDQGQAEALAKRQDLLTRLRADDSALAQEAANVRVQLRGHRRS